MIGDTTYDVEMGRSANCWTIGVDWGYHAPDALREAGVHHMARDFEHLARIVDELSRA